MSYSERPNIPPRARTLQQWENIQKPSKPLTLSAPGRSYIENSDGDKMCDTWKCLLPILNRESL